MVVIEAMTTLANMGRLQTRKVAVKIATAMEAWWNFRCDLVALASETHLLIFEEAAYSFTMVTMKLTNVTTEIKRMLVASRKYWK